MSRQRNRRRLEVQSLETRKLMAGDYSLGGFPDPFINATLVQGADEITIIGPGEDAGLSGVVIAGHNGMQAVRCKRAAEIVAASAYALMSPGTFSLL